MELGDALKICGFNLPGHEIRDLIQRYDTNIKDGKLDFVEFQQVCQLNYTFFYLHS